MRYRRVVVIILGQGIAWTMKRLWCMVQWVVCLMLGALGCDMRPPGMRFAWCGIPVDSEDPWAVALWGGFFRLESSMQQPSIALTIQSLPPRPSWTSSPDCRKLSCASTANWPADTRIACMPGPRCAGQSYVTGWLPPSSHTAANLPRSQITFSNKHIPGLVQHLKTTYVRTHTQR